MKGVISRRTANRILLVMVILLVLFSISADAAEAKVTDTIKKAWNSSRKYVKSPAYWVNALIVFGALFLLQIAFLRDKLGSDTVQKVILYIVLGLLALVISTKIVASNGVPQYVWKVGSFAQFVRFLLGTGPEGTYTKTVGGETVTRQGIFRANDNGAGLPALIVAFVLLYLLGNKYKSELGFDAAGGRWLQVTLSAILAALIANQGTTKNMLIIIGGWIAVLILGGQMSRSFGGESDQSGAKKGFGFGLAFAFIQLIANMLGTSLFFSDYSAADITIGLIIRNILIGLLIGWIYSSISGEGVFGRWRKSLGEKRKKEVKALIDEGNHLKAFFRSFPVISAVFRKWLKPGEMAEENTKKDEKIAERIEKITSLYEKESRKAHPNPVRLSKLNSLIVTLEEELTKELTKKEAESIKEDIGVEVEPEPEPAPAQKKGAPAAPDV